jgi:hypothetical protein
MEWRTQSQPSNRREQPTPLPELRTKPDTIEEVTPTSITIKHIKVSRSPDGTVKETPVSYAYALIPSTSTQVDGKPAGIGVLKRGMIVSVSATGSPGQTPPPLVTTIIARSPK